MMSSSEVLDALIKLAMAHGLDSKMVKLQDMGPGGVCVDFPRPPAAHWRPIREQIGDMFPIHVSVDVYWVYDKPILGAKSLPLAAPSLHDSLCRVFGYSLDATDEQIVATARKAWGDERVKEKGRIIEDMKRKLVEQSALVERMIEDVNRERKRRCAAERIAAEALLEERKGR